MLNITVKPGEYFTIGDDIRIAFVGGTANNARVLIDAPKSYNIVRGKVLERTEAEKGSEGKKYYPEPQISEEKMKRLLEKQKKYGGSVTK